VLVVRNGFCAVVVKAPTFVIVSEANNPVFRSQIVSFYRNCYPMKEHHYYVYIVTNPTKKVLYMGVTNNLSRRLEEHFENRGKPETFAGKYFCYNLVYWEHHQYVLNAIEREKEIKGWKRIKKEALISSFNDEWRFLNHEVCELFGEKGDDLLS
jgi:putative endonuclease